MSTRKRTVQRTRFLRKKMVGINTADPALLIEKVAGELKNDENIVPPAWAMFAKTGVSKEKPPEREDWWYVRAASILRKISLLGPIGTNKLRRKYGGKQNRGHKPDKFKPGSANIIRKALQQLEQANLIIQTEKDKHKGRVLTPNGQKLLAQCAKAVALEGQNGKK